MNPPAALANGHQALPDKVAAEVYKVHLQCPPEVRMKDVGDSVRGTTSDMGVEMGLPSFRLRNGDPTTMLPSWVESHGDKIPDVDIDVDPPADEADELDMMEMDVDVADGSELGAPGLAPETDASDPSLPPASSTQYLRNSLSTPECNTCATIVIQILTKTCRISLHFQGFKAVGNFTKRRLPS